MAKKKNKKEKQMKRLMRRMEALNGGNGAGTNNGGTGAFGGLSRLLPSRRSDQFMLGLMLGAAGTYVLSDDDLRGKIMRSGVKLYASLAGGLEEMKEQMADIKAEVAHEQDGAR